MIKTIIMSKNLNTYKTFNIYENTPKAFYDQLDLEFHFDFDTYPQSTFDGLLESWNGNTYINPPCGKATRSWLEKGISEIHAGNAKICVFLLPACTDVKWFHEIVLPLANEVRFISGRLKLGEHNNTAPFASMVVIFK